MDQTIDARINQDSFAHRIAWMMQIAYACKCAGMFKTARYWSKAIAYASRQNRKS